MGTVNLRRGIQEALYDLLASKERLALSPMQVHSVRYALAMMAGGEAEKEAETEHSAPDWTTAALALVQKERERQNVKWGDQSSNHPFEWMSILGEEYGELCEAVNETHFHTEHTKPGKGGTEAILHEATQVAAVAVAIMETKLRVLGHRTNEGTPTGQANYKSSCTGDPTGQAQPECEACATGFGDNRPSRPIGRTTLWSELPEVNATCTVEPGTEISEDAWRGPSAEVLTDLREVFAKFAKSLELRLSELSTMSECLRGMRRQEREAKARPSAPVNPETTVSPKPGCPDDGTDPGSPRP